MNANPALGLIAGFSIAESKGLTGGEATKVAMIGAIAPFPMGVVLASVLADREAEAFVATRATAGFSTATGATGTAAKPPARVPPPTPAPEPAAVLNAEFAKLQAAAAQLATHESQATIDTKLEYLVQEIREWRQQIEEENKAAVHRDREARHELAESEATEKREEAAERKRETGKPAGQRGS
jgi:hypothetical protein